MTKGLARELVMEISRIKDDPEWMRQLRLQSLDIYNSTPLPTWGPDLSGLDLSQIETFVWPKNKIHDDWSQVPPEIRDTFSRLGIPQAEEKFLAGVGAQLDSEMVYHRLQEMAAEQGVYYADLESALHSDYESMIREHFATLIKPTDHKFAALHTAVWSGGSFVYLPPGVSLTLPLQAYFRLNAKGAGQFEHTLIIVDQGASLHFIEGCSAPRYNQVSLHAGSVELFVRPRGYLRYTTIENWSRNMYNLNTKRAYVDDEGVIEWVSGSFGSCTTCLYPESILAGDKAKSSYSGVTFAGTGQCLDTGFKVQHLGRNTSSHVQAKSIAKGGGVSVFRSSIWVGDQAANTKTSLACHSLILDAHSRSDTIPAMVVNHPETDLGHEASVGRVSDEQLHYLQARGLTQQQALQLLVSGFVSDFTNQLPLEYALEMNNLLNLELSPTSKEGQI